jgi:hypothetical protein
VPPPLPQLRYICIIRNRVRKIEARGRKSGGYLGRLFGHLLNGLAAAVARLQREPVHLLLDPAA